MLRVTWMDNRLASIDYICVDPSHIARGRAVPDGYGALTLNRRGWAYCSAARPEEPHQWKETGGVEFSDIRHADLPDLPRPRK